MPIGRTRERRIRTSWLSRAAGVCTLESLESRLALSGTPLPTLADMESPNDTVVRLETNYGVIDIELFNAATPITVSNFLNYVKSGRYGDTFFHRSAIHPNPFVIQGGGFAFSDATGESAIATDLPITNEASRSNLARTVAMARTNDPNSATSQFFINLVDNTFLNPSTGNAGYAVFGKVIQGWDTVMTIQGLQSLDLSTSPAFAGPDAGAFTEVPVGTTFNSSVGLRQRDLVELVSAQVIKPSTTAGFFTQTVFYPEGFRSQTSVENLELFNPNGTGGTYQVVVHYETGQRDSVVATGTIGSNAKLSITLSDFAQPGLNTVRSDTPYSVEVDSAFPESLAGAQPVAASMNRVDFNAQEGEAFFNPASTTATGALQTWDLPRIERNDLSQEFVVYQNLTDTTATVTTVFHTASGNVTVVRSLGPHRRGGLEVFHLGLTNGVVWAHVTSTQDIVAAVSNWHLPDPAAGPAGSATPGWGALGVDNGGSTAGAYAGAEIKNNFTSTVSFVNPSGSTATVTLKMWRASGLPVTRTLIINAGARNDLVLDSTDLGIPADEFFTVTYTSTQPVAAQYTSFQSTLTTGRPSDGVSSTFNSAVPPIGYFADGALDPTVGTGVQTETISLFSPFASGAVAFTYTVKYFFSDGTEIDGASGTLTANSRVDVVSGTIAPVRAKAASSPQFRNYGIAIVGNAVINSVNTPIAPLAVLTRFDNSAGHAISSSPMFSGLGINLSDPRFA
jgi:cyclophilin family peptidyl-prolyl cis-trans isomerase